MTMVGIKKKKSPIGYYGDSWLKDLSPNIKSVNIRGSGSSRRY